MLITLISLVIEPGAELAAPQTGCQDGPVFGAGGTDDDLWATVSMLSPGRDAEGILERYRLLWGPLLPRGRLLVPQGHSPPCPSAFLCLSGCELHTSSLGQSGG